jgi:hypothetical protein
VGPRAGLDAAARRKILCPYRGSNPDHLARSQTLYCLSYRDSRPKVTLILFTLFIMLCAWTKQYVGVEEVTKDAETNRT